MVCSHSVFCVLEGFCDTFWCPFRIILRAIWDPGGAMGTPSGPPRVQRGSPKSSLRLGRKRDGKVMISGGPGGGHTRPGGERYSMGFGHFGTPGKGSRLHGSAFQGFTDFPVPCGKGFPDGEPGFLEGLPEKRRDLKRSKNNETPHANSA